MKKSTFTRRDAILTTTAALAFTGYAHADPTEPLTRIAFGSCAKQTKPQPIWDAVLATNPDLFVFLGDNVYADTIIADEMKAAYDALAAQPGFQKLKSAVPIRAIWDDHDYGINDGGLDHPNKDNAREQFCDFWNEPADSPRRTQEGGIHTAYLFGPPGQRVHLILPDLRWSKTPAKAKGGAFWEATKYIAGMLTGGRISGAYEPIDDPDATMIGAAQWAWLEAQLQVPADLRIIGSSLQVLSRGTGWEAWDMFPHEQKRFENLIGDAGNVVLISGDVHYAEISKATRENAPPLWELTASGLTETWPYLPPNDRRVSAWRGRNFGLIEIDWKKKEVTLSARDEKGGVRINQSFGF